VSSPDLDAERRRLEAELAELVGSLEYGFAMGHSQTLGDHPVHRELRRRAAELRARIAELRE
jgi:hypothetical protein